MPQVMTSGPAVSSSLPRARRADQRWRLPAPHPPGPADWALTLARVLAGSEGQRAEASRPAAGQRRQPGPLAAGAVATGATARVLAAGARPFPAAGASAGGAAWALRPGWGAVLWRAEATEAAAAACPQGLAAQLAVRPSRVAGVAERAATPGALRSAALAQAASEPTAGEVAGPVVVGARWELRALAG